MQTFYLLTILIEYSPESVSDYHYLFHNLEDAKLHMPLQIAQAAENFEGQSGRTIIDLPTCREWRNDEGFGYTVCIEEISPIDD